MAKLTLSNVTGTQNQTSLAGTINSNSDATETALENTLSRDGTAPNQMEADLDMNSNRIINLPDPVGDSEPATKGYVDDYSVNLGALISPSYAAYLTDALNQMTGTQADLAAHIGSGGTSHAAASTSVAGFMSATDKDKVNRSATTPEEYGALGGLTDDITALTNAISAAGTNGSSLVLSQDYRVGGILNTVSNLKMKGSPGKWLKQTAKSSTGSFLTNVTSVAGNRDQQDIVLEDIYVDGSLYIAPVYFVAASGSTTTVVLPSGASAVDNYYNGYACQIVLGAGRGQTAYVSSYVGSTRTATFSTALSTAISAGDTVVLGYNDNAIGFAWGADNVTIRGGVMKNYPMLSFVPFGSGGKGINFEQGVYNSSISDVKFFNCMTGLFLSGKAGTMSTGVSASVVGVTANNIHAENCGSAITVANLDLVAGIPSASGEVSAVINNVTFKNCGHAPYRIVGVYQQKNGIINLMGANGVTISNVFGYNESTYPNTSPGYPTDYNTRCGYGLSGDVGAVIWGHARNSTLRNIIYTGNADYGVCISRVRALGDDAPPSGAVSECFSWDIDGLTINGTVSTLVKIDSTFPIASDNVTGTWRIRVNTVSSVLVDTGLAASGLTLDITETSTGKRVIGTPAQIIAIGNTFASLNSGTTDLRNNYHRVYSRTFTLSDDTATSLTPPVVSGMVLFASDSSLLRFFAGYRASASPQCAAVGTAPSYCAVTTGALTGTTGTDGNFTVSTHTDSKIYIENRRGGTITVTLTFLG